jgi:hypothetical protein
MRSDIDVIPYRDAPVDTSAAGTEIMMYVSVSPNLAAATRDSCEITKGHMIHAIDLMSRGNFCCLAEG